MRININIRKNMVIRILTIILSTYLLFACSDNESETDQATRISHAYDIDIQAGDPALFFPMGYTKQDAMLPTVKMEATSLKQSSEALDGIESALSLYPSGFVTSFIDAIYISGSMEIEGAKAGGTFGPEWIVLSNIEHWNGTQANYENFLRGVHHELSSLVLKKSIFTVVAWPKLLPSDWTSSENNYQALTLNEETEPNYASGFLTQYGETSMGNDFNVYAEFAFTEPEHLKKLAKQYSIIAQKLGLFISAYTNVLPKYRQGFTDYFNNTGLSKVAIPPIEKAELILQIQTDNLKPTISQ